MPKADSSVKRKKLARKNAAAEEVDEAPTEAGVSVSGGAVKEQTVRDVFYAEEEAVSESGGPSQMEAFVEAKDSLLQRLNEIQQLKRERAAPGDKRYQQLKVACLTNVLQLKRLNREAQFRLKKVRQRTNDCKTQIDSRHLQLQNLLYECTHLQREIIRCQQFRSRHEDIELLPVDEFYATAPEEIAQPELTRPDEHEQMLARLKWENCQRAELAAELRRGQQEVAEVQAGIRQRRQQLDSLRPLLDKVAAAAEPLREILGSVDGQSPADCELALLLPPPLYVAFNQLSAYASAEARPIDVSIVGDREEAAAARDAELRRQRPADKEPDDDDDDDDDDDEEAESQKQKRKKRQKQQRRQEADAELRPKLSLHPLSVRASVGLPDWPDTRLVLCLHHVTAAGLVTVRAELQPPPEAAADNRTVVQDDQLLAGLYPGDGGRAAPNAASRRQLFSLCGLDSLWEQRQLLGVAYGWAQRLGGLNFLPDAVQCPSVDEELSYQSTADCLRRARRRASCRLHLLRRLDALSAGAWSSAESAPQLPPAVSQLAAWQRVSRDSYCDLPHVRHLLDEALAGEDDLFFVAELRCRASAPAQVAVCVPADYPGRSPLLSVAVGGRTSQSDLDLRAVEAELNVYPRHLLAGSEHDLLLAQLQRLLLCADIFFGAGADARRCPRRRLPARQLPFCYSPALGLFVHRG